jgi:PTS system nitrogen regulatory IIA component
MKLSEILPREAIIPSLVSKDKKGVLEELARSVAPLAKAGSDEIVRVLLEREQLGSTGIGGGIGIPHGKLSTIDSIVVGFGLSRKGVEFDSLDNKPVHIVFLLITPEKSTGSHLRVLAQISKLLRKNQFKESLLRTKSVDEIQKIILDIDEEF